MRREFEMNEVYNNRLKGYAQCYYNTYLQDMYILTDDNLEERELAMSY